MSVASATVATPVAAMDWILTYADCDPAGLIFYATAFELMERLYTGWAVEHAVSPDQLRRRGMPVPVVRSATGEFLGPLRSLDRLRCRLYCDAIGRSSMDWRCTVGRAAEAAPSFVGHLRQVYVGPDGRPVAVPAAVRRLLAADGPATGGPGG